MHDCHDGPFFPDQAVENQLVERSTIMCLRHDCLQTVEMDSNVKMGHLHDRFHERLLMGTETSTSFERLSAKLHKTIFGS